MNCNFDLVRVEYRTPVPGTSHKSAGICGRWLGSRLWQELKLDQFFAKALGDRRGSVEWAKVIELLAVNRLCEPESELGVHQRWYGTTAMDVVLGTDDAVAAKDRLYRALDKAIEHKESLEQHLAGRWQDLFGARMPRVRLIGFLRRVNRLIRSCGKYRFQESPGRGLSDSPTT